MTLTETLKLKERFLKFEDLRALDYCEKRWLEESRPLKRWEMFNFIEKMLQELKANGIGYSQFPSLASLFSFPASKSFTLILSDSVIPSSSLLRTM
jgi:hypothetical protein